MPTRQMRGRTTGADGPGDALNEHDDFLFHDPEDSDDDRVQPARRKGFVRRHPVIVALASLLTLAVLLVASFAYYINTEIDSIDRVAIDPLPEGRRPPVVSHGDATNILLAGVDKGDGRSIAEIASAGWDPGVVRSDTIMVLHLTANREHAYVISIPRDSYVPLYDESGERQQMVKINAAFSLFGPTAYMSTVENLTDLRMQHLAVVDWAGFEDITDALGGVEVYVPETLDEDRPGTFQQGTHVLDGADALAFVRTRYDLPGGDFGRIYRQQNFIRALLTEVLSKGTLTNPFTFTPTVKAVVNNLTVDDAFDTGEIRNMALSMRGIEADDVTFLTAPFGSFGTTSAGSSIVHLDADQSDELWRSVRDDDIDAYLEKYGAEAGTLPGPDEVR